MLNITSTSATADSGWASALFNSPSSASLTGGSGMGQIDSLFNQTMVQMLLQMLLQIIEQIESGESEGSNKPPSKPAEPDVLNLSDAQQTAVNDDLLNTDEELTFTVIDEDMNGEVSAGDTLIGKSDGETMVEGELTEEQAKHINGDLGGEVATNDLTDYLADFLAGDDVRAILDTDDSGTISAGDTLVTGGDTNAPADYSTLGEEEAAILNLANNLGEDNGNDNGGEDDGDDDGDTNQPPGKE